MLIKINNIPKIRSYQTLVYKNGNRTFRTKEYMEYFKYFTENAKFKNISYDTFVNPINVKIELNFSDNNFKRADVDNLAKPVLDWMEKDEIIKNDNLIHRLTIIKQKSSDNTNSINIKIKAK